MEEKNFHNHSTDQSDGDGRQHRKGVNNYSSNGEGNSKRLSVPRDGRPHKNRCQSQSKINKSNHPHKDGNHGHPHHHGVLNKNEGAVFMGFLITIGFMFVEFIGGYICGSLALTADAGHMLIDSMGLLLSWLAFRFGKKAADPKKTFGYSRLEIIASLVNSIFLFGLSIVIVVEAVRRLLKPVEVMTVPMLAISILGLIVNCVVFYMLNRGETNHLNIKAAILHVLGDLLGSVAAIVAAVVIYLTNWSPIDSILSVFVCLLILNSVWRLFRDSFNILMEGTPPNINIEGVKAYLVKFPNIKDVHDIHIWSITSNKHAATLCILVRDEAKTKETVRSVKRKLAENFGVYYSTVEVS